MGTFLLRSGSFEDGRAIPRRYTCDGDDVSPALGWEGCPPGTRALALIVEDPDAPRGLWTHWVLFDLPPDPSGLAEGVAARELPPGAVEGGNSWGRTGYGGPCPPSGTHRYVFRLLALDAPLGLPRGATAAQVLEAARGRTLAEAHLTGTYTRA